MARRRPYEEHENHERWLVSYADFITLLFAFFVVMYSVSSVNEGKFRVLSDTLVATFKAPKRSLEPIQVGKLVRSPYVDKISARTSPVAMDLSLTPRRPTEGQDQPAAAADAARPGESPGPASSPRTDEPPRPPDESGRGESLGPPMADVDAVAARVQDQMADLIAADMVAVRRKEHWLEVEFNTNILFSSGEARLAPQALLMLTEMAEILMDFPNPIQVEGFTDDVPIHTAEFPSNWELSAARAASVVHLFMKVGVSPERMVAIGYGEHRPVAGNDTAEGRRRNRRVVLVVPAGANSRRLLELEWLTAPAQGGGVELRRADG